MLDIIKTQTTGGLIGESLSTNISKGLFVFKNYIFGKNYNCIH